MRGRSGGFGVAHLGIGGFLLLLVLSWVSGTNLFSLLGTGDGTPSQSVGTSGDVRTSPSEERTVDFVGAVTKDVQNTWAEILGTRYERTRVVLFREALDSACGFAQAAMGPFYCPPDKTIYLDTGFFRQVETRFHGCSGNACKFTAAYIIAHEAGHHVQNLLGILPRVTRLQQQSGSRTESNALQVRVELQADCLSGVWVNREEKKRPGFLEAGDIDAALTTASAIGDDTLQRQATGRVVPDSFTHGSAAQRKHWFMTGYQQGTVQACNTFGTSNL